MEMEKIDLMAYKPETLYWSSNSKNRLLQFRAKTKNLSKKGLHFEADPASFSPKLKAKMEKLHTTNLPQCSTWNVTTAS